jgi:hypothetical protein
MAAGRAVEEYDNQQELGVRGWIAMRSETLRVLLDALPL